METNKLNEYTLPRILTIIWDTGIQKKIKQQEFHVTCRMRFDGTLTRNRILHKHIYILAT